MTLLVKKGAENRHYQPVLAAAVAAGVAVLLALGIDGLGDVDPYRHLEYAHQLWKSRFSLHGHPYLPFTLLGSTGVDLWWGFHLLLVPFTALGTLAGARVAGVTIAAVHAAGLTALLRRAGQPVAWVFGVAPLAISSLFAFRDHLARPAHLTTLLFLVNLFAGAGLIAPLGGAMASMAHGLLHLSSPLSPLFAGLGLFGARITGHKGSLRALVWSTCGLAAALILRPDRLEYLNVAVLTNLGALGLGGSRVLHTGMELQPMSGLALLEQTWPGLLALAVALGLGRGRPRSGHPAIRAGVLASLAIALMLTLRSARFVDYLVPLLALYVGLLWPADWKPTFRATLALALAASVGAATLLVFHVRTGWKIGNSFIDPPRVFENIAEQVRSKVAPGTLLFTDDPFITEVIYASLPDYQYVVAFDPSLLYFGNRRLFWIWHHAVVEGTYCDGEACPGLAPDPNQIAAAVRTFGTNWVITSYPLARFSMQRVMLASPQRFELVAQAAGPVTGLYLWRVKRDDKP